MSRALTIFPGLAGATRNRSRMAYSLGTSSPDSLLFGLPTGRLFRGALSSAGLGPLMDSVNTRLLTFGPSTSVARNGAGEDSRFGGFTVRRQPLLSPNQGTCGMGAGAKGRHVR